VAHHWLVLTRPITRYSVSRDAYVLRVVGRRIGPVLLVDRRHQRRFDGVDRRRASVA
jgi:hypothetical protein